MTIDVLAHRLASWLAFSGVGLLVAAAVCWSTVGDGDATVQSIHHVAGAILAVGAVVLVAGGLTLSAAVSPSRASEEHSNTSP